ncbi:hypothetical protein [Nonomuraea guangzhouensis]|uniref:Uncharacterized protein n=1 Tax=Nonomuraea guangzhouensis TaxID=1291555 RepID=A0ABW4GFB8_9ACTN|nr:hypothetical protein [Nonomuraea guangzhouensis]
MYGLTRVGTEGGFGHAAVLGRWRPSAAFGHTFAWALAFTLLAVVPALWYQRT